MTNPEDPGSVARRYVEAIGEQDWETVADCWRPGALDVFVGIADLRAPDEIVAYFRDVMSRFPTSPWTSSRSPRRTSARWCTGACGAGSTAPCR
ncbi:MULTISPECIES: nuclear transport factor 2 family protein [Nocardia]|uniref:nuclear transport factor 2 family protein n=1 Tax=Nocardia TaxID=1817 RepID=UPI00135A406B|nr:MULTISPECIES: nuclear transport factor 2 family protein [Nocardia]